MLPAGSAPVMAQMVARHAYDNCSILAVEDVPREETRQYGIVGTRPYAPHTELVDTIVEKPLPHAAPSTLAVVGRYVLTPGIFDQLARLDRAGGAYDLTDAIANLMWHERVLAYRFEGRRYDCGSKLGLLKANLDVALARPDTGPALAGWLGLGGNAAD